MYYICEKKRKKNERKRERERGLSNSAFNHPLDFPRLTSITRERDVTSCLVITLSLFLFFSSGALFYEQTKSRFPLLFLFFLSLSFFFRYNNAQYYDNSFYFLSMFLSYTREYRNNIIVFFLYNNDGKIIII